MKVVQLAAIDMTINNFLDYLNQKTLQIGHEVHCVCSVGPYKEEMEKKGYIVHNIEIARKISPIDNLLTVYRLTKLFKEINPDIVHVHTPVASVLGRYAAKLAGVKKIIYTAHGFYFHEEMPKIKYNFFFEVERLTARLCTDYLFTQSYEDYQTALGRKFLKKPDNIIHIGNGIDLDKKYNYSLITSEKINQLKEKYGIEKDDKVITFIGRLVKEKGILDLLEAFSLLNMSNVKLFVIGGVPQGERDQDTVNILDSFSDNENIHFTGHINNAEELLFLSDIFCLPSYREGMPRSIIEAMAMKNAIVATNIRGSREEVIHGYNGYLTELGNVNELLAAFLALVSNEELLDNMKSNSYSITRKSFDERKVVSKQLDIFNRVER